MRVARKHTAKASERTPRPTFGPAVGLVLGLVLLGAPARADNSIPVGGDPGFAADDDPQAMPAPPSTPATSGSADGSDPAVPNTPAVTPPMPQGPTQSTPAGPPPPHTGVKATLRAIPGDFAHLPSWHTAVVVGGGGLLALAVHPLDQDVNVHLKGSSFANTFFAPGKVIGQGPTLIGASFAVYGLGRAMGKDSLSHLGMDLLRSTIEDAVVVYAIKVTARRERPNGQCCSFPSGHASVTFAAASVLWRHLGWKAAVPTYTVAAYVAASRLHENVHYLSDVVFGSAIGVAIGHTVTMHTLKGHENWAVTPVPVPGGMAMMVSF